MRLAAAPAFVVTVCIGAWKLGTIHGQEHDSIHVELKALQLDIAALDRDLHRAGGDHARIEATADVALEEVQLCHDRAQWLKQHQDMVYKREGYERARLWGEWPE